MREKLLRWGLNDRDESVRQAAKKMFNYRWVDDVGGDLLEVLERLDVTREPNEGGFICLAMKGFWENRKDVLEDLTFDDGFWENLTPEGSFLARTFNDYCRNASPQETKGVEIDELMPEVTRLAFYLQKYINKLVAMVQSENMGEATDLEFIVQQLLLISMTMDYGDEIGRRKMFALFRESLGIVQLPEPVTKLIVEGLKMLTTSEGDFSMLILEVIAEIHDTIAEDEDEGDGEDSFHSAQSDPAEEDLEDTITVRSKTRPASGEQPKQKKQKLDNGKRQREEDEDDSEDDDIEMMDIDDQVDEEAKVLKELTVNMKCLHIAQCMLENISAGLKSNPHVVSLLNGLVVPAVRSHESLVREAGLRCLGLSCLIDQPLTEQNLGLFSHCFSRGHEKLQVEALHIISDILHTHGAVIFTSEHCSLEQRQLYRILAKATKMDESEDVQATAVEVICKLMLAQVIKDEEVPPPIYSHHSPT
jgi:condensin complex subunit 3